MKKFIILLNILWLVFPTTTVSAYTGEYERTMKQDLLCLMLGYPEYVKAIERDAQGSVYVVMKSGKKIIYDDKRVKTSGQRLADSDLQDIMEEPYPLALCTTLMVEDKDPGRYRCYELLQEVYGQSRAEIEKKLKSISFVYGSTLFNSSNGAAAALEQTGKVLIPLMKDLRISSAVYPGSGTYNYRVIAGTGHLSPHAYGIAIDLARDSRDYWQWATREEGQRRLAAYPQELVEAFESNGFIWGGKWSHFDILHFEYRPELLLKARYFAVSSSGEWYQGAPLNQPGVKECIETINNALE